MEIQRLWDSHVDHIEKCLSACGPDHNKMISFIEEMSNYYRGLGCNEQVISELKSAMMHKAIMCGINHKEIKEKETHDELEMHKRALYNPDTESCIVVDKHQLSRVIGFIDVRNGGLKDEADKIRWRNKPGTGKVVYRVL